jgi:amino acid adenylation domain-containing protein/non-ribosomal peptide synthase protein (TIGR01720 family)
MSDSGDKDKSLLSKWLDFSSEKEETQSTSYDTKEGPLTHGQERLYFLQDVYGNNPFYHYAEVYHFEGNVHLKHLIDSFLKVVGHHDILRTTFELRDGELIQVIHDELSPIIEEYDVSQVDEMEKESHNILYDQARAPFDLKEGPLVRLVLVKKGTKDLDVLVSMHHIITDKWSMRVLRHDWAAYYSSLVNGKDVEGLSRGMRYLDHAIQLKNRTIGEADMDYWQKKLSNITEELPLDHDRPRPKRMTFEGGFVQKKLEGHLSLAVLQNAKQLGVTPFVFLLSAYKVLLHHYTSILDIVVGSPVSNRNTEDLESSIGFFNETLILRDILDPAASFSDLVKNVQSTVMEAFDHAKVPFEILVNALKPQRKENVNPLFQVMFLYHDVPPRPKFEDGIDFQYEPFDIGVAKFDLTLYVSNEDGDLTTIIEYSKDLFEEGRIESMLDHFENILAHVTSSSTTLIKEIDILTQKEKDQLLSWGRGPELDLPKKTVIDIFKENVRSAPEAEAAWFEGRSMTYRELDHRSDACARYLVSKGIKPGNGVGIMTPPGFHMITAILGILKAGAFYLPLDPDYPEERIEYMLDDAGVDLILGEGLESLASRETVAITDTLDTSDQVLPAIALDGPAYMIYTSGSTGQPKGVLVHHDTLLNSTMARLDHYPESRCRYLLLSSFSFDSSVAGIFWPLICGGCLVMVPRRSEQDVEGLSQTLKEARVTHTLLLPSLYRVILDVAPPDALSSLEVVIVAGEACPSGLIQEHFDTAGQVRLYNEYGPTEATVWCSVEEVLPTAQAPVPIGGPIANTRLYVLDPLGNLCPQGVSGELFVGGKNVTPGYYKKADLTAKRFIYDPFQEGKMYRTGDRAKWSKDGRLIFLGREDGQVKVRGHRIELEAIKNRLEAHDGISRAEVIIIGKSTNLRIAAFYSSNILIKEDEVKRFLSAFLPGYMIPDLLTHVSDFPRLPNGKVDRSALSELIKGSEKTIQEGAENDKEAVLIETWKKILKLPEVGTTDNFFSVGGDSIKSIQVIAHLRKEGYTLKTEDIFSYQTIRELSHVLKLAMEPSASHTPISGRAPLLPVHDWHFKLHKSAPGHWGQAYSIELETSVSLSSLENAVQALVTHHDGLRAIFDLHTQEIIIPSEPGHSLVTQADIKTNLSEAIHQEMSQMDPGQGRLFRVLSGQGGEVNTIILLAHHLVVDAYSWPIILEDLHSLLFDPKEALPPRTDSILTWSEKVAGLNDKHPWSTWNYEVPTWENVDVAQEIREAEVQEISLDLENGFQAENSLGLKVQEALLAAVGIALGSHFGMKRILVDLEGIGRKIEGSTKDVSRTVGWLTSIYSIPFDLPADQTLDKTAIHVKETLRSVPDQGLSFYKYNQTHNVLPDHPCRLVFNYLGEMLGGSNAHFKSVNFEVNGVRDPRSERDYLIEVNILKSGDKFEVNISYHAPTLGENSMTTFADLIQQTWSDLTLMLNEGEQKFTPGDFPDIDISQDDLDLLMDQFD